MEKIDAHSKSIKKAVRYIKQDATREQLKEIKQMLNYAISMRLNRLDREMKSQKGESI